MTVVLAVAGAVYNLAVLAPAALFAVVTYVLWMHASGRLAARIYRRVEQRAAASGGPSMGQDHGETRHNGRDRWRGAGRDRQRRTRRERARRANGGTRARPDEPPMARREARDVLNVSPSADQERITQAYRTRVKEVHPDTEAGDSEAFKRVQDAYETLQQ